MTEDKLAVKAAQKIKAMCIAQKKSRLGCLNCAYYSARNMRCRFNICEPYNHYPCNWEFDGLGYVQDEIALWAIKEVCKKTEQCSNCPLAFHLYSGFIHEIGCGVCRAPNTWKISETKKMAAINLNKPDASDASDASDPINRPAHYTWRGRECIDMAMEFIRHQKDPELAALEYTIFGYFYRYPKKNGIEDLKKIRRYIDLTIKYLEEKKK